MTLMIGLTENWSGELSMTVVEKVVPLKTTVNGRTWEVESRTGSTNPAKVARGVGGVMLEKMMSVIRRRNAVPVKGEIEDASEHEYCVGRGVPEKKDWRARNEG